MLRFNSPCEVNIMTNVNVFLTLFIAYLQMERNYAEYKIEHSQHAISNFFLFIDEQANKQLKNVYSPSSEGINEYSFHYFMS